MSSILMTYKGKAYPKYLREGHAASYIFPFAQQFCKGKGLDIGGLVGCHFPEAQIVNIVENDGYDAYKLPSGTFDYIFSSHTLEHLPDYIKALEYWKSVLTEDGVLFLYLPHPEMEYWLPQNNRKHLHCFYPEMMEKTLKDIGFNTVFVSGRDLYWSFCVIGVLEK